MEPKDHMAEIGKWPGLGPDPDKAPFKIDWGANRIPASSGAPSTKGQRVVATRIVPFHYEGADYSPIVAAAHVALERLWPDTMSRDVAAALKSQGLLRPSVALGVPTEIYNAAKKFAPPSPLTVRGYPTAPVELREAIPFHPGGSRIMEVVLCLDIGPDPNKKVASPTSDASDFIDFMLRDAKLMNALRRADQPEVTPAVDTVVDTAALEKDLLAFVGDFSDELLADKSGRYIVKQITQWLTDRAATKKG